MKSMLAIQCLPLGGEGKEELYRLVDRAIAVIEESGLPFMVGPMETVVQGPIDQLLEVARRAHEAVIEGGGRGAATYLKLLSAPELDSLEEEVRKYRERGH